RRRGGLAVVLPVVALVPRPRSPPLLPYTTLFRSLFCVAAFGVAHRFSNRDLMMFCFAVGGVLGLASIASEVAIGKFMPWEPEYRDLKSTRLNSSHVKISYAVFCLKKDRTLNS